MNDATQQAGTGHFDAAKKIVETLTGLDHTSQALAMRFASETLGLHGTPAIPTVANPASASHQGATHSTDIKQFTAAKMPKSDLQFAAVVAYFYRFEAPESARQEQINAEILQEATRLAGRERLRKPYFTLNNAKNAGYLDAVGDGAFRINAVGENLVAMALPGNGAENPPRRSPGKKGPSAKKQQKAKNAKAG